MTRKWPEFVTKDLGDDDDAEMQRRWEVYNREMQVIIASGTAYQDADGWWVDSATGELIGPDPQIERPLTEAEVAKMRPASEIPEVIAAARRARGPARTKEAVSIRLDIDIVEKLRASGPGWQSRVNAVLRDYLDKNAA